MRDSRQGLRRANLYAAESSCRRQAASTRRRLRFALDLHQRRMPEDAREVLQTILEGGTDSQGAPRPGRRPSTARVLGTNGAPHANKSDSIDPPTHQAHANLGNVLFSKNRAIFLDGACKMLRHARRARAAGGRKRLNHLGKPSDKAGKPRHEDASRSNRRALALDSRSRGGHHKPPAMRSSSWGRDRQGLARIGTRSAFSIRRRFTGSMGIVLQAGRIDEAIGVSQCGRDSRGRSEAQPLLGALLRDKACPRSRAGRFGGNTVHPVCRQLRWGRARGTRIIRRTPSWPSSSRAARTPRGNLESPRCRGAAPGSPGTGAKGLRMAPHRTVVC